MLWCLLKQTHIILFNEYKINHLFNTLTQQVYLPIPRLKKKECHVELLLINNLIQDYLMCFLPACNYTFEITYWLSSHGTHIEVYNQEYRNQKTHQYMKLSRKKNT